MDVKVLVADPGQAGYIKKVGRLAFGKAAAVSVRFSVCQKACVEIQQIGRLSGHKLGEGFVLLVEVCVGRGDEIPSDQTAVRTPTVFELVVGIYNF